MKQLPTRSDSHILVPSVIQLRTDIRGKSLSLWHCASLTRHLCRSSNVSLSFFPSIKESKYSKMYFSIPVPPTCSISAGTDPYIPYFRSPNQTLSNAFVIAFFDNEAAPLGVLHASLISSKVASLHFGLGSESSCS